MTRTLFTGGMAMSETVVSCPAPSEKKQGSSETSSSSCVYEGPDAFEQAYASNLLVPGVAAVPPPPAGGEESAPLQIGLLGFGAIVPNYALHALGRPAAIDSVDQDFQAIHVAEKYLGLPQLFSQGGAPGAVRRCSSDKRLCVAPGDARKFVQNSKDKAFDVLVADIFDPEGDSPAFLSEPSFLQECARVARSAVVVNTAPSDEEQAQDPVESQEPHESPAPRPPAWKSVAAGLRRAGFEYVYTYGFSKPELAEIQRSLCPCKVPGDACGCGEENRFVLATRRPLSPASLPPSAMPFLEKAALLQTKQGGSTARGTAEGQMSAKKAMAQAHARAKTKLPSDDRAKVEFEFVVGNTIEFSFLFFFIILGGALMACVIGACIFGTDVLPYWQEDYQMIPKYEPPPPPPHALHKDHDRFYGTNSLSRNVFVDEE